MPRVQQLPARVGKLAPRCSTARSGDARIRGGALQVIRERILSRAMGVCECVRCRRAQYPQRSAIVDHIVPLWAGGREDDSNRQAISVECHDAKSAHEAACRARGYFTAWQG